MLVQAEHFLHNQNDCKMSLFWINFGNNIWSNSSKRLKGKKDRNTKRQKGMKDEKTER